MVGINRSAVGERMFVVDLLGYNLRGPLVGGGITVTVKDLGGVIAQQGVDFVFTVAPVCVQRLRLASRVTRTRGR